MAVSLTLGYSHNIGAGEGHQASSCVFTPFKARRKEWGLKHCPSPHPPGMNLPLLANNAWSPFLGAHNSKRRALNNLNKIHVFLGTAAPLGCALERVDCVPSHAQAAGLTTALLHPLCNPSVDKSGARWWSVLLAGRRVNGVEREDNLVRNLSEVGGPGATSQVNALPSG